MKTPKPQEAWAFFDKDGKIIATNLPQKLLIIKPELYPESRRVIITPIKKQRKK